MLVLAHVLEYFDIWDAHEYSDRWLIEMREKESMIRRSCRATAMWYLMAIQIR
jgi:hypothetical protein